MPEPPDTINMMLVCMNGGHIWIMNQPCVKLTQEQALSLAAHIVSMVDPSREKFNPLLTAILEP